jgi:serine protease AprX
MSNRPSPLRRVARAVIALVCLLPSGVLQAQTSSLAVQKLDSAVADALRSGQSVRAIVRFESDTDRQRGRSLVSRRGGRVARSHEAVTALTVDIDAGTINSLAYDAGVLGISIDARVRSTGVQFKPSQSRGVKKPRDQARSRGSDVAIAIIDSGVRPHLDLPASRIRAFVDFVNGQTEPYDDFGHGTHVAGIAAGTGAASAEQAQPYEGFAPNADIVALKVLDAHGAGNTSDVIAALEWVGANYRTYNIRVVNLSLGHPVYERAATDPLVQAAEALVRRGIVVVASAGNMGADARNGQVGFGGVTSPANGEDIIAVGAVDDNGTDVRSDDRVTNYSSRGPTRFDLFLKPDIVASGHHVVSTSAPGSFLFDTYPTLHVTGGVEAEPAYMTLSGTSMSAPAVAGAAALVLEANPALTAHAVQALLEFTAQRIADTSVLAQGSGYLNARGAVRLARLLQTSAPVGSKWLAGHKNLPSPADVLFGEQVQWGRQVVWGQRVLLGNSVYINSAAWRDHVRWGKNLRTKVWGTCTGENCDNVVWGNCEGDTCDNVVWGNCDGDTCDNVVWGNCTGENCDNVVWGNCQGDTCDNVVWGNCDGDTCDNVVWGNMLWLKDGSARAYWASNTVWGFWAGSVDWTTVNVHEGDNVVWGNDYLDNVVWGNCDNCDNVVWGNTFAILADGLQ